MKSFRKICRPCSAQHLLAVQGLLMQLPNLSKMSAVALAVTFAIGIGGIPALKGYQYTAWIIAAVVAGMIYRLLF
jgi:BASS family bile acid:Na+ symporter